MNPRHSRNLWRTAHGRNTIMSLSRRNAASVGDGQRAFRYALRVSRSVVVSLSLSRRNAASESEEKSRGSWLVKTYHHNRIGYNQISQRAALAGTAPTQAPVGAFFLRTEGFPKRRYQFESVASEHRIRRGRPKGVPLRAEGITKRRCHFESVAAKRCI